MAKRITVLHVSRAIQKLEEALLAGSMLVIAALTVLNVASRSLLGSSLAFAEEISQFLIVVVVFVGLSYAAAKGRHIRMTAIFDQLPRRARKRLMIVIAFTTAVLMFSLASFSARYLVTMVALETRSPVLQTPLWAVYLVAPIGFTLAGVQYCLTVVRNLKRPGVWLSFDTQDGYDEPTQAAV